ncbi:unnamed protein product, partial [Darwinula stevensoni]
GDGRKRSRKWDDDPEGFGNAAFVEDEFAPAAQIPRASLAPLSHLDPAASPHHLIQAMEENWSERPKGGGWLDWKGLISQNRRVVNRSVWGTVLAVYVVYMAVAIAHHAKNKIPIDFCGGLGFLIIITGLVVLGFAYAGVKMLAVRTGFSKTLSSAVDSVSPLLSKRWVVVGIYVVLLGAVAVFLGFDTKDDRRRLISVGGICVLILLGFIFSKNPRKVNWRQVSWGLGLQFLFGLIILRWDLGEQTFQCLSDKVTNFLAYTDKGTEFVYGFIVTGSTLNMTNGTDWFEAPIDVGVSLAFKLLTPSRWKRDVSHALQVLPVIFFFSFCIQILFYYGAMQWVVLKIGWLLQVTIGTTAAESMNAAANIFVGQTEAPILIKPYLPLMTKSEIHAVMTGGFATIAGEFPIPRTVFAAFVSFGVSGKHLLSASVMSAPAALACSKLFYPETEQSHTKTTDIKIEKGTEANALDAAATGASNAISLVANIIANLIAMLAFVAFLDGLIEWLALLVGWEGVTFQFLIGKAFIPIAYIMGVPWDDCEMVGELIGMKTIINEFVAYLRLVEIKDNFSDPRSEILATYALCGFSNLGSIGIQLGGLSAMAPERRSDLSKVAVRALIAGTTACLLTACIAGMSNTSRNGGHHRILGNSNA